MEYLKVQRCHDIVRALLSEVFIHGCIAGGYARWALVGGDLPGDVDFFPYSPQGEEKIHEILHAHGFRRKRISLHAHTFVRDEGELAGMEFQVIRANRFPGASAQEILRQFSLTIQQAAMITVEEGLGSDFLERDEDSKTLRPIATEFCPRALSAALKYIKKGYSADDKAFLAYYTALEKCPPEDWNAEEWWLQQEEQEEDEQYSPGITVRRLKF